jgi:membrane protease YdiL (CAAX protease family)
MTRSDQPAGSGFCNTSNRAGRPVFASAVYLLFVFGCGLALAPWVYWAVQEMGRRSAAWQDLAAYPFNRYITRCMMAMAVIGLWPYLRALGIRSAADAGLRGKTGDIARGFVSGCAAIAVFAVVANLLGGRIIVHHTSAEWLHHFRNAALAAIAAGFLEELVFRGALFRAVRCKFSFVGAAIASATVYALVHFFARPENLSKVHWYSGFVVLGQMLDGFRQFHTFIPAFPNVLVIGLFLALAYERTGAIFFGIGLHAALIFMSKTVRFASDVPRGASEWFWGSNKVVDGWFAFIILIALYLALFGLLKQRTTYEPERARRGPDQSRR